MNSRGVWTQSLSEFQQAASESHRDADFVAVLQTADSQDWGLWGASFVFSHRQSTRPESSDRQSADCDITSLSFAYFQPRSITWSMNVEHSQDSRLKLLAWTTVTQCCMASATVDCSLDRTRWHDYCDWGTTSRPHHSSAMATPLAGSLTGY